ncbi:MAG: glycosyltransferase family 1 protein [Bacteroidaceae bacterium]|nr:glycosyltransferase family 1 protein [Bacteroidaceae bacterium]
MAHFCFMVLGSRGDVQPMLAVALQLLQRGHQVTLCTGASFEKMVSSKGIRFVETSLDLMSLADSDVGRKIFHAPVRHFNLARKVMKEYILPRFRKTLDQCYEAAKDADIIIYHPKVFGAVDMAIHLNIPCVVMPAVPILSPVKEFPNLGITTRSLGSFFNKLSYKINDWAEQSYIHEVNDFRQQSLNLPPRKAGLYAKAGADGKLNRILYPFSDLLFPDVSDWNSRAYLSGFCFLEQPGELSPAVIDFLQKGTKPIVVSFGSVDLPDADAFFRQFVLALKQTGNRAICIGRKEVFLNDNHKEEMLSEVLFVKESPFLSLFPFVKGVVCHGGIGTGSSALLCGVPLITLPISADQPFWAKRYGLIGCLAGSIKIGHYRAEDIGNMLRELDNDRLKENLSKASAYLKQENGASKAADYLERMLES